MGVVKSSSNREREAGLLYISMAKQERKDHTLPAEKFVPAEFLEACVFPVLLPGLEDTLREAKNTKRRRQFNSLDYLSAYLYKNNPNASGREDVPFQDIPFVKEKWSIEPRPPLPLSAILTETEAATIIQAFYRGYRLRCTNPHVVEFRKWQRRYAEEKVAARKIQSWWRGVRKTGKLAKTRDAAELERRESGRDGGGGGGETGREVNYERRENEDDEI